MDAGLTKGRPLGGHSSSQLFGAAPLPQPEESYVNHLVTDWAIEQMNQSGDKPLFLAVGLFRPHIPWEVPKRWFDLYPLDEVQLPKHLQGDMTDAHSHGRQGWHKWVTENRQWKKFMQGYLASITTWIINWVGAGCAGRLADEGQHHHRVVGDHGSTSVKNRTGALWDQTTRVPFCTRTGVIATAPTRQPDTRDIYQPSAGVGCRCGFALVFRWCRS